MKTLADLGVRSASGALLGAVFLSVLFFGGIWGLAALIAAVAVLATAELYRVSLRGVVKGAEFLGLGVVAVMPFSAAVWGYEGLFATMVLLLVCILGAHIAARGSRLYLTSVIVFGALYVGLSLSHLVLIRRFEDGLLLTFVVIASVWANDVLAYGIGSTMGRHPLALRISPKKSWEGVLGGTLGTMGVWIASGPVLGISLEWPLLAVVGVVASSAAVGGDLVESRFKREYGVKDSGTLLPGHGGFLDRFDSFILVSVVTYYALLLAGVQ